ncbi:hypothetical protein SAMN05444161_1653 [Rhizobiales bacterium GAS191]|nr:hypothetical protein SAMN05519103_00759 [Rhizobiales bacterium GAS113]SEC69812.1 hypothetical protein SAMN05444161_1653 [Rhizobiales bacterium GAS191]
MVDIPFPRSSQPGSQPGEGLGRLLNRYFELDGDIQQWKTVPGLVTFADTLVAGPRGSIDVNGTLYDARAQTAVTVTSGGAVTALAGTLNGTAAVTWAKNNRASGGSPTPDVVCVTEAGAFSVSATAVSNYPDINLPQPNSVAFLDGYFLFTTGDGRIFASGVNDIWVNDSDHTQNALAFTTADQSGGLVRGTSWGGQFFAFGQKACTVYQDAGLSPFPLSRTSVIPIGLASLTAITGFEPGWGLAQFFVATDDTVRRLDGYAPVVVSNKDVERAISAQIDKTRIEMSCHVVGGRPVVVVKGPAFTWEYNAATGYWNERQSANLTNWRASRSVYFSKKWLYGDTLTTQIVQLSASEVDELGTPFTARLESGPVKQFPNRIRCTAAYFDFTSGQGTVGGTSDSMNPSVLISSSLDGGGNWSTPQLRRDLGAQGYFNKMLRVNRIGGVATQHGIRFRLDSSSPVYSSFRGGRADIQILGAP